MVLSLFSFYSAFSVWRRNTRLLYRAKSPEFVCEKIRNWMQNKRVKIVKNYLRTFLNYLFITWSCISIVIVSIEKWNKLEKYQNLREVKSEGKKYKKISLEFFFLLTWESRKFIARFLISNIVSFSHHKVSEKTSTIISRELNWLKVKRRTNKFKTKLRRKIKIKSVCVLINLYVALRTYKKSDSNKKSIDQPWSGNNYFDIIFISQTQFFVA